MIISNFTAIQQTDKQISTKSLFTTVAMT